MNYGAFKGSKNPLNLFGVLKFKKLFKKAHPEYFDPDGILVFCGAQGQGKTISAVSYVLNLVRTYSDVVVCSNVDLSDQDDIIFVDSSDAEWGRVQQWLGERETGKRVVPFVPYDSWERLLDLNNGYGGVLYLIDEMHLEFNSLESKQMDSSVFYMVSQQRKNRKHIVGTAQVFQRLAKPFREQFKFVVMCRCLWGGFQYNQLLDGLNTSEEDGKLKTSGVKPFFWFHTLALYESYDTLQVIHRTREEWKGGS